VIGMGYVAGIDLGTTTSYLAFMPSDGRDRPKLAPCGLFPGERESGAIRRWAGMPSRVLIAKGSENRPIRLLLPGRALNYPEDLLLVARFKAWMGEKKISVGGKIDVRPDILAAFLIKNMLNIAQQEEKIGIDSITITVPAMSTISQRRATEFAVRFAGFEGEINILEEPTSAFVYHHWRNKAIFERQAYTLVIDFGGGTCDFSLLRHQGANKKPVVVSRCTGYFGGEDIDRIIAQEWLKDENIDFFALSLKDQEKLREYAREAKETLSTNPEQSAAKFDIGYLDNKPHPLGEKELSQEMLERILKEYEIKVDVVGERDEWRGSIVQLVERLADNLIGSKGVCKDEIGVVILAGGSTRLKEVRDWAKEYFGKGVSIVYDDPEACVALGAAVYQYYRSRRKKVFVSTLASDIQVECAGKSLLLGRQGEELPIDSEGLLRSIFGGRNWLQVEKEVGEMGERQVRINVKQGDQIIEIPIAAEERFVSHLWIRYYIGEDGIIKRFQYRPCNWLPVLGSPLFSPETIRKVVAPSKEMEILPQFDWNNPALIRELRETYDFGGRYV